MVYLFHGLHAGIGFGDKFDALDLVITKIEPHIAAGGFIGTDIGAGIIAGVVNRFGITGYLHFTEFILGEAGGNMAPFDLVEEKFIGRVDDEAVVAQ